MPARLIRTPFRLTATYVAFGFAWIIGTDWAVRILNGRSGAWLSLEMAKGLFFVALTGSVLYVITQRFYRGTVHETEALTNARARTELSRRMYDTLSAVNRRIIRPADRTTLAQSICDALIDPGAFQCSCIGRFDAAANSIHVLARAGAELPDRLPIGPVTAANENPLAEALRSRRPVVCHDVSRQKLGLPPSPADIPPCSVAAIPFQPQSGDPMLLAVGARTPELFSPDVIAMLVELAADVEYALEVLAERERREAAEAALRASEERYRLVAENSQDVIWIASVDGRLEYVSPSIRRLLGYTAADMLQMSFDRFMTPESVARVQSEMTQARDQLASAGNIASRYLEVEQVRADGTTVWTEVNATGLFDGAGQWQGVLGVTRDITQRRAAEQALAAEVARCRALLDVSVDGIHVTDLQGRLLDANEIFLRERGFTREMVPTLRIEDWNAEMTAAEIKARQDAMSSAPTLFETVHRRKDGTLFPVEIRGKRIELNGRKVVYCATRDVTERKGLEQRLLRSQRLESVGLIASGIAHDLNNVLTPILLSTGLLEMRYNAPEDRALLDPIEAAARRGSNIVQQILTFARGAEGQRVAIEPKILLKELSSLMRETFPRNIVHRLEISPDARPVIGDLTQLHQVFLNLSLNARDAMPEGGTLTITVANRHVTEDDVRAMPTAKPGDYVCLSVTDTGTGMMPDVLDHLFEPFFTTKPRGRGTGLGLSTVHGLVRSHGGFVDVSSKLGQGSQFRVFLPPAPPAGTPAAPSRAEAPTRLGRGEHVLVADDEPAILTIAASVLRRHGFVALTAGDGDEALGLFDNFAGKIAVVIADVMMPKFDGVRLAAEVRRRDPKLPIIAMSGLIAPTNEGDSREQLRALGVTTILDKPYGETELLHALETALGRRSS